MLSTGFILLLEKVMNNSLKMIVLSVFLFSFIGCQESTTDTSLTSPSSPTQEALFKAYYVDDPIVNIDYICGTQKGKTDSEGGFFFEKDKGCSFYIGEMKIRQVSAKQLKAEALLFENDPTIAAFLHSLNAKSIEDGSIVIDSEVKKLLKELGYTQLPTTQEQRETIVEELNANLSNNIHLYAPSLEAVQQHLQKMETRYAKDADVVYLTKDTDSQISTDSLNEDDQVQYIQVRSNLYLNPQQDVALLVVPDLNKSEKLIYNDAMIQKITKELYESFEDQFDFIFLVTNNKKRPLSVSYAGVFSKVQNDVEGIGVDLYNNSDRYGSSGKLKGIMHLAYRNAILQGPTLHEIAHYWANKFRFDFTKAPYYRLGSTSHWGETSFFGGKGQLGGSDANTFAAENYTYVSEKTGKEWKLYSADYYGWNANGANRIPYNDVELYLMGMLPKEEVKDLIIPKPYGLSLPDEVKTDDNFKALYDSNRRYFLAQEVERLTWSELLNEHNIPDRNPSYEDAQKEFRVLTVLLDTQLPKEFEVESVSAQIESLAYLGDDGNENNYNFWEATRHQGKLLVQDLQDFLQPSVQPQEVALYPKFEPQTILFRGLEYKTVKSPYTDRIWLDRNLGATKVCESYEDSACYGYSFAFGRGYDGSQERNAPTTDQRKTQVTDNDNKFVVIGNTTPYDWVERGVDDDIVQRLAFFEATNGDGVCPQGFRVPTIDELSDETKYNEKTDPFPTQNIQDHFLRLPYAGYKNSQSTHRGSVFQGVGNEGAYWSITHYQNSEQTQSVRYMHYYTNGDFITYGLRYLANALSIRCIKEQ